MPFIAKYRSADPKRMMLGGVSSSLSSRFESREDAELRLQSTVDIHASLCPPLKVEGEIVEVSGPIDIYSDGSTRWMNWGRALQARREKEASNG